MYLPADIDFSFGNFDTRLMNEIILVNYFTVNIIE